MKKAVLLTACCAGLNLTALAQTPPPPPAAVGPNPANTLQQINGAAPANNPSGSTPVQAEDNHDLEGLDVVKTYPVPKTFTAYTSQSVFWTDNAFLQRNSHVSAFGYSGRFGLSIAPYSTRDWTPSISYSYQLIRYDRTSVLDFEAMTLAFASKYNLTKDGTSRSPIRIRCSSSTARASAWGIFTMKASLTISSPTSRQSLRRTMSTFWAWRKSAGA
jgi:hypothetical protein